MLKLRRDIVRALSLLEMVKMREKAKQELLSKTLSVMEKRYELQDWSGQLYSQYTEQHRIRAPRPAPPIPIPQPQVVATPTTPAIHQRRISEGRLTRDRDDLWTEEQERHFRPSLHRSLSNRRRSKSHRRRHSGHMAPGVSEVSRGTGVSDTEEMLPSAELIGDIEETEVEGPFPFRRRKFVQYRQVRL
jgi:enhancer of polycomb-like protein